MLSFQPRLVAAGYHVAKIKNLFGLDTQELQAKRILASFDRWYARQSEKVGKEEMAKRWMEEVFNPILAMVPAELQGRVEKAQMFHEILENRWYMTEKNGYDVGLEVAAKTYINEVLPLRMDSGVETQ
jgi:hypothetical protein